MTLRPGGRSFDSRRLLHLLAAIGVMSLLCLASSSARAAWSGWEGGQNCVPSGTTINGSCETLVDACESWALFRETWVRRIDKHYDANGNVTGATCVIRHFLAVGQDFRDPTSPSCPAGYVVNGNYPSGCQLDIWEWLLGLLCGDSSNDRLPSAGNPISVVSGNKFQAATDYQSANAHGLELTRYYNSQSPVTTVLGPGWRHSFDRRLSFNGSSQVIYYANDGKVLTFNKAGADWLPASDVLLRLSQAGDQWELKDKRDRTETYDGNGRLLSVSEKDGYQKALEYNGPNGKLSLVHDSHGHRLRFVYDTNGMLASITDDLGRKIVYRYRKLFDYENQPETLLAEVIYPDGTPLDQDDNPRVKYLYEDPAFPVALTGMVDENGERYATWAYDEEGRAISSEHAGGVDSFTVAYNPDGSRTVTNPLGKQTTYNFITINGGPKISQVEGHPSASCLAANTDYAYDANGFLSSTTDWEGNVTNYAHDSRGLLTSLTEAVGTPEERTTTTIWHNDFRVPTQIVAPRQTIDLTYDADGLLTSRQVTDTTSHVLPYPTNGQTRAWTYSYSDGGKVPSTETPLPDILLTLANSDAETGDTTGWTVTEGAFTVRASSPAPSQGAYYFYGGAAPSSRMYQDIAVPASNEGEIDGGLRAVRVNWRQRSQNGNDQGTVILSFIDAAQQPLGEKIEHLRLAGTTWTSRELIVEVPPATRTVRLELRAIRNEGTANDAYFDEIAVSLVQRGAGYEPLDLVNGAAESGDITGWTSELGAFGIRSGSPRPVQGDYYFFPGAAAQSRMSQVIAFPAAQHDAIDNRDREFELFWRQNSYDGKDQGAASFIFLDGASNEIGSEISAPAIAPSSWTQRQLSEQVPPGARAVRVSLSGFRQFGTNNDAYFDYISANLVFTDVAQMPLPRQLVSIDGPRSDVTDTTTFGYTDYGELETVTNALGHVTSITERDKSGLPLTLLDENGIEIELAYDARDRLVESRVKGAAGGAVTTYEYDAASLLTRVTLPDGSRLVYEYDAAQRLTAIANNLGERIEYTLDAMGSRTGEVLRSASGGIVRSQTQVFDELGRLLQSVGADSQVTAYGYDTNSNVTSITDPLSGVTAQAFDPLDRLVQQTDPLSGLTTYAYDAQDNLASVTDPRGLVTTYTYNGFGDVIQLESPDTGATVLTLDGAGNVVSQTDARGMVTDFTYDALNRPLTRSYPATPAEDIAYGYDDTTLGNRGIGRLTSVTDRSGATVLVYDDYGNLIQESRTIDGVVYTTGYSFDVVGNLLQMTYPDGRIVSYGRDALGRVTSILTQSDASAAPVVVASDIAYEPFGPVSSLTFGNGVELSYSYDQDYRLTAITAGDGSNDVQDLTLTYDNADNITAITDLLDSARDQSFQYDGLYRLTQASGLYGTIEYDYDAVGNRTARTIVDSLGTLSETYTNDTASNRLLSVSDGTTAQGFAYSASGQITADDRGAGTDLGFVYDASDRLVQLQAEGTPDTDYLHNAFGERVAKELIGGNEITHFHYGQGGQLLGESDELGAFERSYIYLAGLPIAQIEPLGGGTTQADATLDNEDLGVLVQGDWTSATDSQGHEGADYLLHPGVAPVPAGGTVLDNGSPNFSTTGLWPAASVLPGFEGADYVSRSSEGPFAVSLEIDNLGAAVTVEGPWNTADRTLGGHTGPDYLWRTANGVSPEAIYIDNSAPGFAMTGYWFRNTWTGGGQYYGSDWLYIDPGADSVDTLIVDNMSPGFSVYGPWDTNVWNSSGPFDSNERGLSPLTESPDSILVDNGDAGFSVVGTWRTSTYTGDGPFVGNDFLWNEGQSEGSTPNMAIWAPEVSATKQYHIYASWSSHGARAIDASYTIHHAGGSTEVVVDQRNGRNRWNLLGTFTLSPASGHRVELSDITSGDVAADAMQFFPADGTPNTATWTPEIPTAQEYNVYAWWAAAGARAPDATYTVHHAGGSSEVTVDQRANGTRWNLLGTYSFAPGSNHRVELTNLTSGYTAADAIKFEPKPAHTLIVDNTSPGFSVYGPWHTNTWGSSGPFDLDESALPAQTASPDAVVVDNTDAGFSINGAAWTTSTYTGNGAPIGSDRVWSGTSDPLSTAIWTPTIPEQKAYRVYAWWASSSNSATNAAYTVHHAGGSTDITVNQQQGRGRWNLLGTFTLAPSSNHRVELTNDQADGSVVADALQFLPVDGTPNTATWTPEFPEERWYNVYAWWAAAGDRAPDATYTVHHAGGSSEVTVDQRANGTRWNLLGTYSFAPGSNHRVELTNLTSGYTAADAIKFESIHAETPPAPPTATWTPDVSEAREFAVYTRWSAHENRATNATYTIHHAAGASVVPMNQQQAGGQWNLLGTYTFLPSGDSRIELTNQANGRVSADAIQLVPTDGAPNSVTWNLPVPESEIYTLETRWIANGNRATDAPYTVHHAGGSDTVTMNQQVDLGVWKALGSYLILGDGSGSVVLTDQANGEVVADAVRLTADISAVRRATWTYGAAESGDYRVFARWTEGEGHATDARYMVEHAGGSSTVTVSQAQRGGQWNELGVFAFEGGQDYAISLSDDANGAVVADALYIVKVEDLTDAVTWVPALSASGTYQVYAKWTSDETRATDARYSIAHAGGMAEVSVNQRVGGGLWHYLGSYTFDPLNTPTVTLAANDNGSVAADAVRFVGGPGGATDIAYLHNDHLGTPQAMTDAAGQLLWWRDQTPFGQTVAEGGFSQNPLRFPGQYADAESGLHYNYFRDYDPALGRYIQSDPIGLGGGLNTYGYVMGNPLRFTDPTGEYGLPGAGYGAISGGIGGYISGGVEGAVVGTVVGAGVGFFAPALSKSAGSAAATNAAISAASSVFGQFFGNLVAGKDLADRCNWSLGAVVGAAAGGGVAAPIKNFLGRFLPVWRPPVIGSSVGTPVGRWLGSSSGAGVEGVAVGGGELGGRYVGDVVAVELRRNFAAERPSSY